MRVTTSHAAVPHWVLTGWPEDVWFHVDALSSAHVYVRLPPGQGIEDIPPDVVRDCSQLCKENSIEGCKKASVTIIYTPWSNLRKDGSMAVRRWSAQLSAAAMAHCGWWEIASPGARICCGACVRAACGLLAMSFRPLPARHPQTGQVSFHNDRLVKKYVVMEKDKETLRRLSKTMEER
jgi:hypothetical protein